MKVKLIVIFLFLFYGCKEIKKECHERWSIKGRLLNGTTMKPMSKVPLNYELFEGSVSPKRVKNQITLGSSLTDDSGYFNFEYDCNNSHDWNLISIYSAPPYQGVVNSLGDFQKNLEKTFYWSNIGTMQIKLMPKIPLNGDTLFIALEESTGITFKDSFTNSNLPALWKIIKGPIGGRAVSWGRGKNQFLTSLKNPQNNPYTKKVSISGDPTLDVYTIEF